MTVHQPILLKRIVDALTENLGSLPQDGWIVDCTFGGGGHTGALLERGAHVVAIDQDAETLDRGRARFASELKEGRLKLLHGRFGSMDRAWLTQQNVEGPIIGLLADLGFSSDQIESDARGLSFTREGPLDMRLDPSQGASLSELLSRVGEKELADVIYEFGEERLSRRIAKAILHARSEGKMPATTLQLAELVRRAVPPAARYGRIHPATRTFQALRIWVNDELGELDRLLTHGILELIPGGRVAILSFHSLEDRKVKQAFRDSADFEPLTRKPVEPSEDEVARNPRARSAKLRVAQRVQGGGDG